MNQTLRIRSGVQCVAAIAIALSAAGCQAHETPAAWKTECVGRMLVSLPGDVDVSATTQKDLQKYSDPPRSSFTDEQSAPWAGLFFLGSLKVVHGLKPGEIDGLLARRGEARQKFRADADKARRAGKPFDVYEELPVSPQNGLGFRAQGQRYLSLRLGNHVFLWSGYSGIGQQQAQQAYDVILGGLRPRDTFSIPKESGVCLPYAFIRDDGKESRHIAMAFRPREHPDITVLLRDVTAAEGDPKANPNVYEPQAQSDSFWTYYDNTYRKSLRSVWSDPYKRVTLGGSNGVESFVRIVREDGIEDYGYLAIVRGDPEAKEDTPDLMLYVIRDAKNAIAKSKQPIDKDEFLKMAQTIAAGVKRRPVQ